MITHLNPVRVTCLKVKNKTKVGYYFADSLPSQFSVKPHWHGVVKILYQGKGTWGKILPTIFPIHTSGGRLCGTNN